MSVEEGVTFLEKNGPEIRGRCTSATIPEILARCLQKGFLSLEEIAICRNNFINLTNGEKWDKISETLQIKQEITLDGVWEIFSGESSSHILTYLRSVYPKDIPTAGSSNQISESGRNPSEEEVSRNADRGNHESQELTSHQNLSEIEIKKSEYILNEENVEAILNFAKDNYTVKYLECTNISTRRVPQILKKFKSIQTLKFKYERTISGVCLYLESRFDGNKEENCLFKIEDLARYPNLKNLELRNLQVVFPRTFPNLLSLKDLFLQSCDISGDFIEFICRVNLEDLTLGGNTPPLTKENVEKLLRIRTLKFIQLGKHYREIFDNCFTPIGPDGRSMEKITPNTKIIFQRESIEQPWVQTIEFLDIVDGSFNLTQDNVDLVLNSPNVNDTVGWLTCSNISTRRIPDIQKKFKNTTHLDFWHHMDEEGKCLIFDPTKKSYLSFFREPDDCLLKMIDLQGFEYLEHLCLECAKVEIPQSFSIFEYLPKLLKLELIFCCVTGNFLDALTSTSNLETLILSGITPPLTRGDVEGLLRNKSLNFIRLSKCNNREIFTGSFTPIGPDGNPLGEIKQNTKIIFKRASIGKPWVQYAHPVDPGEFHLNNRNFDYILNSPIENTTVTKLICTHIPTMRVPAILNKFKFIQKLEFQHFLGKISNKCVYFGSMSNARREDICLFKMADLAGFALKILILINVDVSFPRTFPNLPELVELLLDNCDISGDFINDFICPSNLQDLTLWGITPQLTKEGVEVLLRKNSLKDIKLGKHFREIFSSSFIPIGPDGSPIQEIVQNSDITFTRDSSDEPWGQRVEEI